MPAGQLFGFLFFFLLFLAAVTSSLSMLQPGIAFLEEALFINRRQSVAILGFITAIGSVFVLYFSKDLKALDTLDFWIGTFMIYFLAMLQIILFGWVLGIEKGFEEAHRGARIRIPGVFRFIMKYLTPVFLLTIFVTWLAGDVLGIGSGEYSSYIRDLFIEPNKTALLSLGLVLLVTLFTALILSGSYLFQRLARDSKDQLS
jgi:neurotransmitter:Na+ symporter, NSS family